jgi:hypothetical protein
MLHADRQSITYVMEALNGHVTLLHCKILRRWNLANVKKKVKPKELSLSQKGNSCSAGPRFHFSVHKSRTMDPALNRNNPVSTPTSY